MKTFFSFFKKYFLSFKKKDSQFASNIMQVVKSNKFDICHKKNACKYLKCSRHILNKSIEQEVLMPDTHYRYNGRRTWLFSKAALEPFVGKL